MNFKFVRNLKRNYPQFQKSSIVSHVILPTLLRRLYHLKNFRIRWRSRKKWSTGSEIISASEDPKTDWILFITHNNEESKNHIQEIVVRSGPFVNLSVFKFRTNKYIETKSASEAPKDHKFGMGYKETGISQFTSQSGREKKF